MCFLEHSRKWPGHGRRDVARGLPLANVPCWPRPGPPRKDQALSIIRQMRSASWEVGPWRALLRYLNKENVGDRFSLTVQPTNRLSRSKESVRFCASRLHFAVAVAP